MINKTKGSILPEISVIAVVLFLVLVIALPALNKERIIIQNETIQDNLRLIANTAQRFFDTAGLIEVKARDIIGPGRALSTWPNAIAGEDYSSLFPINVGFDKLSVTRSDGITVLYEVPKLNSL